MKNPESVLQELGNLYEFYRQIKKFKIKDKENPNLIVKPSLCVMCKKDEDPSEEIFCTLNRADQVGESEFHCGAYEPK